MKELRCSTCGILGQYALHIDTTALVNRHELDHGHQVTTVDLFTCYADTLSIRLKAMGQKKYQNGFTLTLHYDEISRPLRWKEPSMIFVDSMSDLFHKDIQWSFTTAVFDTMMLANWHIYQILTKRPNIMRDFVAMYVKKHGLEVLPNHIWVGTSIGMKTHLPMIDMLRDAPATIRFISAEPLVQNITPINLDKISWLITGGPSGTSNFIANPEWFRALRQQCREQNVPFYFKQYGGRTSKSLGPEGQEHNVLDGRTYQEFPLTLKDLAGAIVV